MPNSASGSRESPAKGAAAAALTEHAAPGQTDPCPAGDAERYGNMRGEGGGCCPLLGESADCLKCLPSEKAERHM